MNTVGKIVAAFVVFIIILIVSTVVALNKISYEKLEESKFIPAFLKNERIKPRKYVDAACADGYTRTDGECLRDDGNDSVSDSPYICNDKAYRFRFREDGESNKNKCYGLCPSPWKNKVESCSRTSYLDRSVLSSRKIKERAIGFRDRFNDDS